MIGRRAVLLLAALLAATPAGAVTKYVSARLDPTYTWAQATYADSACTMTTANTNAAAGDVILMLNSTYTVAPAPATDGTDSLRISFIGNIALPDSVEITAAVTLARTGITLKGANLSGGVSIKGVRDSLADCKGAGLSIGRPSTDCMIARWTGVGTSFSIQGGNYQVCAGDTQFLVARDSIKSSVFTLRKIAASGRIMDWTSTQDCYMDSTLFTVTAAATACQGSILACYWNKGLKVFDSKIVGVDSVTAACNDGAGLVWFRDNCDDMLWARDTILLSGPGKKQISLSRDGHCPSSNNHNRYLACVFKVDGPTTDDGYAVRYQSGAIEDTIQGCVVASSYGAFSVERGTVQDLFVDHSAFASFNGGPVPVVAFGGGGIVASGLNRLTNSIIWTAATSPHGKSLMIDESAFQGHIQTDWNGYWTPTATDSMVCPSCWNGPYSSVGSGSYVCIKYEQECHSRRADPGFLVTTSVPLFDAHLTTASPFAQGAERNTYAGPYIPQFGPDVVMEQPGDPVYEKRRGK